MSLLKKIASVFGKKDEPTGNKAKKQQETSSNAKQKKKQPEPGTVEWRPGQKPVKGKGEGGEGGKAPRKRKNQGPKGGPKGGKPQGQKKPRPQKKEIPPFEMSDEERARMKEFRPEEDDRRIAYEKRLKQRWAEKHGGRPERPPRKKREPRGDGERKPRREEGERKPRERKPREDRQAATAATERKPVKEVPWDPASFNVEPAEGKIRFQDLDLHPKLMQSIHALGWEYATPIQGEILPGTLKGKDMAGRAQTGTGKTAAFLISIINHCLNNPLEKHSAASPRALIIAPTRELAMQIGEDSAGLNRFTGLRTVVLYGGMDYNKQQRDLEDGLVDIVVATPGRLLDFENKNVVSIRHAEIMVIDEADRMLDMGFIPDVRRIIYKTPPKEKRQTVLFSATLSDDVMRLAAAWMVDPERIDIEPEQVAVDTVEQKVFIVTDDQKFTLLYNIIKNDNPDRIIIFTNRRDQAERLSEDLDRYGHKCEMLSGAVTQKKRMRILEDFKAGKVKVLVATDVAGRGIHVDGLSHVVNFNIPENPDDYVHRIGRTGRAGSTGQSITFACEMESFELPKIEELLGMDLPCKMPSEALLAELPAAPPRKPRARRPQQGGQRGGRRPQGGHHRPGQKRSGGGSGHRVPRD
ncbi:DEAD/DEAH box helicase [Pontiella agarivorans]|uniref:DEAD/DEAH box helicase n=1 Tax=Pontiella agarivorans TaxID=3038953 RepID=A0ABU5MXQ6_9BACT|nr:DEAD/DEAH box helicase [Pontiella agarivorans]MDZ8118989.1 DEAD/DEAH box helicase [Pontiella agarivorans]